MGKNLLPPGFRFHPTDVELVKYYLKRKVLGRKIPFKAIPEVDIYKYAPWDLPDMSILKTGDLKWLFYCPVEKKYSKGSRLNRATVHGYWKTTGKDRPIKDNGDVVGMIKTLVFHRGKAPRGERTDWVMHEYRLTDMFEDKYVLCVLFKKDGRGPRNGAQYGAPFNEEDWSDDEDVAGSLSDISVLAVGCASSSCVPENQFSGQSVGIYTHTNTNDRGQMIGDATGIANNSVLQAPQYSDDDEVLFLLASFQEDNYLNSVLYA